MYSYLPFCILFIINSRLVLEFKNRKVKGVENDATKRRKRAMNRTVIFITLLFIAMTLPSAVSANFNTLLLKLSYGQAITFVLGRLSSSYHAYSLVFLYLTNQKFAEKLRTSVWSIITRNGASRNQELTKSQTGHS